MIIYRCKNLVSYKPISTIFTRKGLKRFIKMRQSDKNKRFYDKVCRFRGQWN